MICLVLVVVCVTIGARWRAGNERLRLATEEAAQLKTQINQIAQERDSLAQERDSLAQELEKLKVELSAAGQGVTPEVDGNLPAAEPTGHLGH